MDNEEQDKIKLKKEAAYGAKFSVIDEIDKFVTESASKTSIAVKIDDEITIKIKKQYEQMQKEDQNKETI